MPDADVINRSVTKNDYTDDAGKKGAVMNFWLRRVCNAVGHTPQAPRLLVFR